MSSRILSTWDPNALGDGLSLELGNLVVATAQNALSNSRKVIGTLFKATGTGYTENEFWSVPQVSLGTNVAIGLAQPDSTLTTAVGADAKSWGFYPATGLVLNNGATVATLDIIPERTVISIYLSLVTTPTMVIAVAGSWRASIVLPSSKSWAMAATLAGGNAGETSLFTNFGQRGFNYRNIQGPPV
jgi:hypothetical protein